MTDEAVACAKNSNEPPPGCSCRPHNPDAPVPCPRHHALMHCKAAAYDEVMKARPEANLALADQFDYWIGVIGDRIGRDRRFSETAKDIAAVLRAVPFSAGTPKAWIVTWSTTRDSENVSTYLKEEDARQAAVNVEMYAHATKVSVEPLYTAPIQSSAQPCPGCDGHECDNGCQYPMRDRLGIADQPAFSPPSPQENV